MSTALAVSDITIDISVTLVAIVTLTTAIVVGLATLPRPSKATVAWAVAYAIGTLGTYLWVAAQQLDSLTIGAVGSGLMLCFEAIIWHGMRMYTGHRAIWWPVVSYLVLVPVVLGLTAETAFFPFAFRSAFLVAGVFAALIIFELFRRHPVVRDIKLPLALASGALAVVSVVGFVAGLVATGDLSEAEQLIVLREIDGVGTMLTCVCTAVTLVLLVRVNRSDIGEREDAGERARHRLLKAKAQRDSGWSVFDVRLDDPDELRAAWAPTTYERIVDAFHEHIREALPASADAERVSGRRAIVLIHGSEEAVAHHLRKLLGRISAPPEDGALRPSMRVSASVGWVGATVADYDYDALVEIAAAAAVRAREQGGDRWEHVRHRPPSVV